MPNQFHEENFKNWNDFQKNLTCILKWKWIFGTEIDIWPRQTISDSQKWP